MEGRTTHQDYDELEMLLGEIPNATSGNPQAGEHGLVDASSELESISRKEGKISSSRNFTNLYNSLRPAKHTSNVALYNDLTLLKSPFNQKCISNSDCGVATVNVDQVASNLPDDQSLESAFKELSFKDGTASMPTTPLVKNNPTSPNHVISLDGQYPNLNKPSTGYRPVEMSVPPSPAMINRFYLPKPASEVYTPSMRINEVNRFIGRVNDRDDTGFLNVNEMQKQKPHTLRGDFGEQWQSFPVFSGAMPVNPGMHTFQFPPAVPAQGLELPASALQRQYYIDAQSQIYMPYQHISQSNVVWRQTEDEGHCRTHPEYFYLQQLQHQRHRMHQIRKGSNSAIGTLNGNQVQPCYEMQIPHLTGQASQDSYWKDASVNNGYDLLDPSLRDSGLGKYYPQVLCGEEERYGIVHGQKLASSGGINCSTKNFLEHQALEKVGKQVIPEKILTRSHGVNSLRDLKFGSVENTKNCQTPHQADVNGNMFPKGNFHRPLALNDRSFQFDGQKSPCSSPDTSDYWHGLKSPQLKYNSVDEVVGKIYTMAQDQNGCRFLQKVFTEGSPDDVEKIFAEIIDHIAELMTNPFGNYLVQKLLEVCNEDQRMHILHEITRITGELIRISCDMHGTRVVQKIIETTNAPEQFSMIVSALEPGTVSLMKDSNGNHVAQRCLQYFPTEHREFLFHAAIAHCVELATDRHGCCVLQKCLYHSDGEQKHRLMSEITSNALVLSEDPYGNYVVQYILDQEVPWATAKVLDQLEGFYGSLSLQKYSSNVVEKCLKLARDDKRVKIIRELMNSPQLLQILQDPYGNYVIQSALKECKGALQVAFVEAIRPYVPALRNSPYGKKVLSSSCLKK